MECRMLSLKWDHHSQTFFETLSKIRQKQTYCDATIVCEENFYSVHRVVMSSCSQYMEKLFENVSSQIPRYAHPVIVLKDIKRSELEAILEYVYVGEVNVLQTELPALIKAAESLGIKGLAGSESSGDNGHERINRTTVNSVTESNWKEKENFEEVDSWDDSKTYSSEYQNKKKQSSYARSSIDHDIEYGTSITITKAKVDTSNRTEQNRTKESLNKRDCMSPNENIPNAPQIKSELDIDIHSNAESDIAVEDKFVKEEYDDNSDDIYIEEPTSEFASLDNYEETSPHFDMQQSSTVDPQGSFSMVNNVTGNQYAYQDTQNTPGMQWGDYNGGIYPNIYNMNYKKRKQRTNVSLETKIEIVKKLRDGVKVQDIMNEYNLAKSAVYEWRKDMDRILAQEKNLS